MSETYAQWSNLLVYGAMAAYAVALVAFAAAASFGSRAGNAARETSPALVPVGAAREARRGSSAGAPPAGEEAIADPARSGGTGRTERPYRVGLSVATLGTALAGLAVLTRGLAASRAPWGNMYEFSVTGAFLAGAIWLLLRRRFPALRVTAVWVVAILLCTLGIAVVVLYVPAAPLVPALRSYWIVIHVLAAMLAASVFTVAMVVSALQIVQDRAEQRGVSDRGYLRTLPSASRLDALAYRLTAFGFPVWTFAVLAGAIWASRSWGQAWQWDPKEVWSLVTWLAYAGYLHARTTAGWQGRKASVLGLLAYATLLFNLFGVNFFFSGMHAYAR